MKKILLIDDEEKLRSLLARIISLEGFELLQAENAKAAWKQLERTDIDVVLCDVKLPDAYGVELVKQIKATYPLTEIILLTAYGNIPDGVQAIKNGAFDYLTKGDDNNKIIPLLYRAVEKVELARRVQQLEKQLGEKHSFASIIGHSAAIRSVITLAEKVASTSTTVLLTGETGTGKEVFAQAIHQASLRQAHPFVAINCSAFGKDLLESEMFGYKAGAFTGALKDKKGLMEAAHKGTLFLDEIGEMPLDLQAKVLRALENGEFIKIGESKPTRVDVRIVAATHRHLLQEIQAGHFREDLYYRLSVFQIELPPLRERTADLEPLLRYFQTWFAAKTNKKITSYTHDYLHALKRHTWPGNIRELKNVIERSVILAASETLTPDTLPFELQAFRTSSSPEPSSLSNFALAAAEKKHIELVLQHAHGNKTKAAELLGIALTTLYRKLAEYNLS